MELMADPAVDAVAVVAVADRLEQATMSGTQRNRRWDRTGSHEVATASSQTAVVVVNRAVNRAGIAGRKVGSHAVRTLKVNGRLIPIPSRSPTNHAVPKFWCRSKGFSNCIPRDMDSCEIRRRATCRKTAMPSSPAR